MKDRPYRVVCHSHDEEWLAQRHKRLTGSAIAKCTGALPERFGTMEDLQKQKSGPVESTYAQNAAMWHGSFYEEPNRRAFSQLTGCRTRPTHVFLEWKKDPRIGCTLDGLVIPAKDPKLPDWLNDPADVKWKTQQRVLPILKREILGSLEAARDKGGVGLLELKQTREKSLSYWEKAPDSYLVQVHTQLTITGYDWALLVCRIGTMFWSVKFIEREKKVEQKLLDVSEKFWEGVTK